VKGELTPREKYVLGYAALGFTAIETAKFMGISDKTVNNHRAHINRKLGTNNEISTLYEAIRRGLINIEYVSSLEDELIK
jgi:DNA-binding CsgD family transcriptional regulator